MSKIVFTFVPLFLQSKTNILNMEKSFFGNRKPHQSMFVRSKNNNIYDGVFLLYTGFLSVYS